MYISDKGAYGTRTHTKTCEGHRQSDGDSGVFQAIRPVHRHPQTHTGTLSGAHRLWPQHPTHTMPSLHPLHYPSCSPESPSTSSLLSVSCLSLEVSGSTWILFPSISLATDLCLFLPPISVAVSGPLCFSSLGSVSWRPFLFLAALGLHCGMRAPWWGI